MKKLLIIIVFFHASILAAQIKYAPEVEEKIKEVENTLSLSKFRIEGMQNPTIQDRMKFYNIKGLSVAVVHNYKIEWAKGYGWADSAEQRPVTTETLFEPGSISKSLNAVGVLKLVQDKKLNLETDINTFLTSWQFPYDSLSKNKKITIAHLLSHTGGLSVHGFPGYFMGDTFPSLLQILDGKPPANTAAVRSEFEPGLRLMYSGGGTMITQLIEMDVTKEPYDAYMFENVFKPIGMTASFFSQPPPKDRQKLLATGYSADGKEIKGKYPILIEQAAGGLWTTPTDLCKFIIELQLSLKGQSNKVLSKEITKKMMTPYIDASSALGVFIENRGGTKYFQHSAGNQGFSGRYYGSLKDGNGLAIVVNTDNGEGIIEELVTAIANAYKWKGFYKEERPVTKKVIAVKDSIEKEYEGVYKQKNAVITIVKKNNELYYQAGNMLWKMYFTSEQDFFNLESRSEKTFLKNANGEITGLSRKADGRDLGVAEKIRLVELKNDLEKYTGLYMDGTTAINVIQKNHALYIDPGYNQVQMKINFISETEFFLAEEFGVEYSIVFDVTGNIKEIIAKAGDDKKIIKKIK